MQEVIDELSLILASTLDALNDLLALLSHTYIIKLLEWHLFLSVACATAPLAFVLAFVVPYYADRHDIRANGIDGPLLAKLSNVWLGWVAAQGHRSEVVHELHLKYGTFVRIAPNHVSVSDVEALQAIYAHRNGPLKSDFYDAFVPMHHNLFTTRSRLDHVRKRKIVSNIFSAKSLAEFEPRVREHLTSLLSQWDRLCEGGRKDLSGGNGEGAWKGRDGWVWLNALPWYNYLSFDIMGDFVFGQQFCMTKAARDTVPVAKNQVTVMKDYGSKLGDTKDLPAVQLMNDRGEYSASMGVLPPWMRPLLKRFHPWYARRGQSTQDLAGIAVTAVSRHFMTPTDQSYLLGKLQSGKDNEGKPMGHEELTAETLTYLIAGSDTISNTSCVITHYMAHCPDAQRKLQRELDEALGTCDGIAAIDRDIVLTFEQVKHLPYLEAVINEGMRIHSASGVGLPREVARGSGGIDVCGKHFPEGTILSVPRYTLHRDKSVWGEDVDVFRPERWFERDQAKMQKAFNPFSTGPRACIGRNFATMKLFLIIGTIFRRYEFVPDPGHSRPTFESIEGFLIKPVSCRLGIRRRNL